LKTYLLLLVVLLNLTGTASAQNLFVASSDPVDGAANIEETKAIIFKLNKKLPPTGSVFTTKFTWSPTDSTRLTIFGQDPFGENDLTKAFFTLKHTPNTDFSFFVYGVTAGDGSTMARPFALNYTTATAHGSRVVSGSAAFEERILTPPTPLRYELQQFIRQVLDEQKALIAAAEAPNAAAKAADTRPPAHLSTRLAGPAALDLNKTIILLLDRFETNKRVWSIRSAAAVQADGTYAFNFVRDGTYWPLAINWMDEEANIVGAYGYYDADGDLEPDSIVVSGNNVPDLPVSLFAIEPVTASFLEPIARERAGRIADDQRLYEILATDNAGDGTSAFWRFSFYSPSQDRLLFVEIDPVNIITDLEPVDDLGLPILVTDVIRFQQSIPVGFLNSDEALAIADANGGNDFRAQFTPEETPVVLTAGDLHIPVRPERWRVFWQVTYLSPEGGNDQLQVFLDIMTGEVLDATLVANEAVPGIPAAFVLGPNYPNPFNPTTTIHLDVSRTGPVTLKVFDLLGRTVRTLLNQPLTAGHHTVQWDGTDARGQAVASGTYLYRMEAGGAVRARVMVLVK